MEDQGRSGLRSGLGHWAQAQIKESICAWVVDFRWRERGFLHFFFVKYGSYMARKRIGTSDIRVRRGGQPHIRAAMTSKDMLYQAQKMVGKWFYDACISFNVANSFQFQGMTDAIASIGSRFKMSPYHQLMGKILQDTVKGVSEHCDELKLSWKETSCSIMSYGWTDTKSRTLLNFLVYCPKDTMLLKSLDLSDVLKTAEILFNIMLQIIELQKICYFKSVEHFFGVHVPLIVLILCFKILVRCMI
ncbi:hypothetical protein EJ110_NYTH51620 [Nymphaea thermarum]|nr:hypothetical protein EJ110_NYTH51620 [Nymphaea thermarum]